MSMFKKRLVPILALVMAAALFFGSGFFWGFKFGRKVPEKIIVRGITDITGAASTTADFGIFWQAWQLINERYLNSEKVTDQQKIYGAVRGLVNSLGDPHSVFFTPEEGKKFNEDIQGNFSGIGAEIGIRKNRLMVISPLKDSPAIKAGLRPGDEILKIDSRSTEGISVEEAVRLIRGPENTEVVLTILRDDWDKPRDFKIIRAPIIVPTLDFEMKEGNIAYIQLYSFNSNTNLLFLKAVLEAMLKKARGMVLDLRGNPGGYLQVAVDLAGWFLPRGTLVVTEVGKEGVPHKFTSYGNEALVKMPVVVLINQGSASASEILAGTLRDNRGVKLIGERSFGKGTVQEIESLRDGSSVKLTVAHWVLPSGKILENQLSNGEEKAGGLEPDIEVKMTEEDIEKGRDPQLEKALEILKEEINKSRE